MFTDTVEIAYQHSINSNLCQIPIQVDNIKSYKAFMFNKISQRKTLSVEFNQWLKNNPKIFNNYKNS